jgi:hypothetical protein
LICVETKFEKKMKSKLDEDKDEERIHRQLREINDEFTKEKQAKQAVTVANSKPRDSQPDHNLE